MISISENLKQSINSIPNEPGIYKMHDKNGNLLYIGKSKSLKSRVRSYFYGNHKQSKINILVRNIDYIETIITDTHLEAQILECALIKKLKPIYNAQFKNHNKYIYLKVEMKNRYNSPLCVSYDYINEYTLGPFKNRSIIRNIIELFQNLYPIKLNKGKYEFEYNLIPKALDAADFQENGFNLFHILSDDECALNFRQVSKDKMNEASLNFDYNTAIVYRDIIKNLEYIEKVKNNQNNYNWPHLLVGERIGAGYKLFFISYNLIVHKKKFSSIVKEDVLQFIEYGKALNLINTEKDPKKNLDFKGIISSELRDKEFKEIALINHQLDPSLFIQNLIGINSRVSNM